MNVADAGLLRKQATGAKAPHERQLALFTLLYKELSRGAYRDFGTDLALVPAGAAVTLSGSACTMAANTASAMRCETSAAQPDTGRG